MLRLCLMSLALVILPSGDALAQYYDPFPDIPGLPEPSSALLMAVALALAAGLRLRSR